MDSNPKLLSKPVAHARRKIRYMYTVKRSAAECTVQLPYAEQVDGVACCNTMTMSPIDTHYQHTTHITKEGEELSFHSILSFPYIGFYLLQFDVKIVVTHCYIYSTICCQRTIINIHILHHFRNLNKFLKIIYIVVKTLSLSSEIYVNSKCC